MGTISCRSNKRLGSVRLNQLRILAKRASRLWGSSFTVPWSLPRARGKVANGSNLLHFARCPKLEKIAVAETKIWFRSVKIAHKHLDEVVGDKRWKWCKLCEREITQRVLDER